MATLLRTLACTVENQCTQAATSTGDTSWISPAADRARERWSWADGKGRTAEGELRVTADHLQRLAEAIEELRSRMADAHAQAQQRLRDLSLPVAAGGQGLPPPLVRAELLSLPSAGDPYWSTVAPSRALPGVTLPPERPNGDPGPTAPNGVVLTLPDRTRALAAVWRTAGDEIGEGRVRGATTAAALPLATLDAYGLPGTRTGALLEDVLGPYGSTGFAAVHFRDAADLAVQAADAIDGLGATFLPTVDGAPVGTGASAPGTLLASFDLLDTAAKGGDRDGIVSLEDLQAAAADPGLPPELRAAAELVARDPALFGLIQHMDADGPAYHDDKISAAALRDFLALRDSAEAIYSALPALVALSDHPNGTVTRGGLERAVDDLGLSAEVRAAAQWLLDHEQGLGVLGLGDNPADPYAMPTMFSKDNVIRLLINGHAFDGRPQDAQQFVDSLPLPADGGTGLPLGMVSDAGVRALANAALIAADGDLSDQVSIISHLPETDGGVRNALISAMYARMGAELDLVANGPLAGDPLAPGHSGANWMILAPWASDGVRDPITGNFSAFGVGAPSGARQAAADGNQWIFSDIGMRYAEFLELYQDGAPPDSSELQVFFDQNFDEGDAQIRAAFAAYAEVPLTADPARRQELMFQGNVLIAIHEQAGAQPYLEDVSVGPDRVATEYIDLRIGNRVIEVNRQLPPLATVNNLLENRPFLDLDPGSRSPYDLAPQALAGVSLADIGGVDDSAFPLSLGQMSEQGGGTTRPVFVPGSPFPAQFPVASDPDSIAGTAAPAWTDRDERMWTIVKLFEQTHTDPELYDPTRIRVGFDQPPNSWLDPATGLVP